MEPPSDDPRLPKQIRRQGSTRSREFTADGYRWVVTEVPAPQFDRRGGTHLMFDGETIMRRVRTFPADWAELSDDELYDLSLRKPDKDD